jgi:hypothetical protein
MCGVSDASFILNYNHLPFNIERLIKMSEILQKCTHVFMYSTCYACQILKQRVFARQIFEKFSNVKFHTNPSSGSRVVPYGRTDVQKCGPKAVTKLLVIFRSFANAPKKLEV